MSTKEEARMGDGTAIRPTGSSLQVIEEWLGPLSGRRLLDVGCGRGALARALVRRGAQVAGIDPSREAVAAARADVPGVEFQEAGAENLPFASASFDAAVMLNSFHHVPREVMESALAEGLRVSRDGLLVVEPLAEGPFFEAMRPVEDETRIRQWAQEAIARFVADGGAVAAMTFEFDDERHFAGVDAFLAKIVAVDPARRDAAVRLRPQVETLVARWAVPESEGLRLNQPHRAILLRPPHAAS